MSECPVCGANVPVGSGAVVGELLACPECGTEIEIKGLNPVTLAEAPQEEEDWGE